MKTTPEHPFAVKGRGYVEAGRLQPGDVLETQDGKFVKVERTEVRNEPQLVYNLEVENAHNFFVGKNVMLVHNGGECVPRTIGVVEQDGDVVRIVGNGPKGPIEVMTGMRRAGNKLVLFGTHIDGPGPGSMGIRELSDFAKQFGRQEGVEEIIVEGARRTTGANPGHTPRPFIFKMY